MADFAPEIYRKAAAAIERELMAGTYYDTHVESEEALARAALDAVAADLGEYVAVKILAHMEAHGPATEGAEWTRRYRRDFGTAARVAAFAFLTEDDKLRMAAAALAAGDFIACPAPEDGDGRWPG
ncbi:MAG TPA: hypothetical protein VIZ43_08470 [Trebonia sp.]